MASPDLSGEPQTLAEAREAARVLATSADVAPAAEHSSIILATIAALKASEPLHNGLVNASGTGIITCEIAPASLDRLQLILGMLATAMTWPDRDSYARDRFYLWLLERIDRWDDWSEMVRKHSARALTEHLIRLAFCDRFAGASGFRDGGE